MQHHSVPFEPTDEWNIPRGWILLALVVASWIAAFGLLHLALQLFAALT